MRSIHIRRATRHCLVAALGVATLSVIAAPPASAAVTGTVTVDVGETLKVRSGPSTSADQVTTLNRGATITIICKTTGTSVNGTTQWDKLANGYVSHAYVSTTATISSCTAAPTGNGTVNVAAGTTLNVRSTPSSSGALVASLPDGASITILCKTSGTAVNGNTQWDKLANGYVAHAYVTSTASIPACTTAPPPPPPPPPSSSGAVAATISAAQSTVGRYPYVYAAGNYYGATTGIATAEHPSDGTTKGFDCSGLMEYAFYQGAGIKLSGDTRSQYTQGSQSGWLVPLAQRKAGDMVFSARNTADPTSIHHVALLTSTSSIVHASDHDNDIVNNLSWAPTAGKTMPYVVRPIR